MQGIDVFLDTYVQIDEGTAVLVCAHRSSARTAAWLFASLVTRGTNPEVVCFDADDAGTNRAVSEALAALRARPGVRRVAVIVMEPGGPSFQSALGAAQADTPERTPIFRITGRQTTVFESFAPEAPGDEDAGEDAGLSPSEIDELLACCDSEMGDLDDEEIEAIAAMNDDEIAAMSEEELAALAELEDSELLELSTAWGEEGFRVLA